MVITITIPDELAQQLQRLADERQCTVEELVIQILEEWLAKQDLPPASEAA